MVKKIILCLLLCLCFVNPGAHAHEARISLTYQLQKVGLLDLLNAKSSQNADRALLMTGVFVPEDYEKRGLDIHQRLQEVPFSQVALPWLKSEPFWLVTEPFKFYANRPWMPQIRPLVDQWMADLSESQCGESELCIKKIMSLWVNKGIAARLTLAQIGKPLYSANEGIEYDIQQALNLTRHDLRSISEEDAVALFFKHCDTLFDRRIALITGKLSAVDKDQYQAELWLNAMFRKHLKQVDESVPLPCFAETLELVQQLVTQRLELESEGVAAALRQDQSYAERVFANYFNLLASALSNPKEYLRITQFLRLQMEYFNDMIIAGHVWDSEVTLRMSRMQINDVVTAIKIAKAHALYEADFFQEQLGDSWISYEAPKHIRHALDKVEELRLNL